MFTKAIDLREFYDSFKGKVVQRVLRHRVRHLWPNTKSLRVAGVGYAVPYLRPFMGEAERVIALMPDAQGAVFWPSEEAGLTALSDLAAWPLETNSVDRIIVVHGLGGHESLEAVLREAWRVLTGQGRIMLLVPNRTGLWARFDNTPFGHGTPYSMGQIRHILKEHMFVPEQGEHALFIPPFTSRLLLATAPVWEKIGQRFLGAFGGVNIVEATKQLYAGTLAGATASSGYVSARPRVVIAPGASSRDKVIK